MDADFWEQQNPKFISPQEAADTASDPYPAVPAELKALPQWVLWKAGLRNGKPTKIPKQASGDNAKSSTADTWTDYQTAITAEQTGNFSGIGFVFTEADCYTGTDLDNCIVDGKVRNWAKEIIARFEQVAYIEVSPSGKRYQDVDACRIANDRKARGLYQQQHRRGDRGLRLGAIFHRYRQRQAHHR